MPGSEPAELWQNPGSPALPGHRALPGLPTRSRRTRGPAGRRCHPTSREAGRLAGRAGSPTTEMWVRRGIAHLSACVGRDAVLQACLRVSSVALCPSQLDEEEERRKRRREKNKVAAARCRNKKKERTEFLQRVSRAGAGAGRLSRSSERAQHQSLWNRGGPARICHGAATPLFFPASHPVPFP